MLTVLMLIGKLEGCMKSFLGLRSFQEKIHKDIKTEKRIPILGCEMGFKYLSTLLLSGQLKTNESRQVLVILPSNKDVQIWENFLSSHMVQLLKKGSVTFSSYPFYSYWGSDRQQNLNHLRYRRLTSLSYAEKIGRTNITVSNIAALSQWTMDPDQFREYKISLKKSMNYDLDDFVQVLSRLAYHEAHQIEEKGFFSIRGGIVDVFPVNSSGPFRLEFFGDHLSSIREFSLEDQRSQAEVANLDIVACQESIFDPNKKKIYAQKLHSHLLEQNCVAADRDAMIGDLLHGIRCANFDLFAPLFSKNKNAYFDYIKNQDILTIFPFSLERTMLTLTEQIESCESSHKIDIGERRPSLSPKSHFLDPEIVNNFFLQKTQIVSFEDIQERKQSYFLKKRDIRSAAVRFLNKKPENESQWLDYFNVLREDDISIFLFFSSKYDCDAMMQMCKEREWNCHFASAYSSFGELLEQSERDNFITVVQAILLENVWDEETYSVFLDGSLIIKPVKSTPAPRKLKNYLSSFKDLREGDFVVHVSHGIGKYCGMKQIDIGGFLGDFLLLEYKSSDKVYVPVDSLSVLQRYYKGDGGKTVPVLDKLGGKAWDRRKKAVNKTIHEIADNLIKIHAKRRLSQGYVYEEPNELYYRFVDDFRYIETFDQLKAMDDIEADFKAPHPMERVIVGDVGFGKTEVAMRACMRAILANFQVVVLVPTTILCFQHDQTFRERFEKYGVTVATLNRFVVVKQQKSILEEFGLGKIDILIGTHRILSKDFVAKNLGLIIVDEEHKFGVSHKEKLKDIQSSTDILTLTATPIPRTLHMAMLGLRDISIIATPPPGRLPVKTAVMGFDENIIRAKILYEIDRGGQVFFIHNRIENIEQISGFLGKLDKKIKVKFAHGRMRQRELEDIVLDLIERKFNVLVCTTIVESGVDMPNVNTLFVNQAENYGLAQLHQLRGRVGRSVTQAYAYFLTNKLVGMKDESRRRLEALQVHQELGSGFHIASQDLEIRGAGNLLGGEQSGQINAVGLEMYTQMLDHKIQALSGEIVEEKYDPEIKFLSDAHIPKTYIAWERDRLFYYKQLFSADHQSEIEDIAGLISDKFGRMPKECLNLFCIARIKILLRYLRVQKITERVGGECILQFRSLSEERILALSDLAAKYQKICRLTMDFGLLITYGERKNYELANLHKILEIISTHIMSLLAKN